MRDEDDLPDEPLEGKEGHVFRQVREQLRYWPYTVHQIEDALDIGLIEGRGRQLLFQAINSRNLTAFVGSGISAAYGRLSWRAWEDEQFDVVEQGARTFKKLAKRAKGMIGAMIPIVDPEEDKPYEADYTAIRAAIDRDETFNQTERYNVWRWLRFRDRQIDDALHQIRRLHATFLYAKMDEGDFPGGEQLPVKFQIAQQLHNQLRQHIRIFLRPAEKTETTESTEQTVDRCWPGARIDGESAAPENALKRLRGILDQNPVATISDLRGAFESALRDYADTFKRPQARASAEDFAKMLLFDERAHAMITLRSGLLRGDAKSLEGRKDRQKVADLEDALGIYRKDVLKRDIAGIRDDPELYRVLSAFRFDTLEMIEERLRKGDRSRAARWSNLFDYIRERFEKYLERVERTGDRRRFLTPSSRFLIATYLRLLDEPWDLVGSLTETKDRFELDEESELLPPMRRDDFISRRSIIANRYDPLAKTVRQLGITRYITMNYDLEIERFFQDLGYRKFPQKPRAPQPEDEDRKPQVDQYRSDPIGGVLIDQTFDRQRASELVAFAVGEGRKDASVFHLHGRATKKERLVITERDYMNLYLQEDEFRDTVNEGITMAFSSSPLLFLGLGMNEADLLRPLRQFMSNRDRIIGYNAVAILPAEKTIAARTKFSVTCFLRYGVYTIFYGSGMVEFEEGGEKKTRGLDWLCRVMLLISALEREVAQIKNGKPTVEPHLLLARICKAVGTVSDDIDGYPEHASALMAMFGKVVDLKCQSPPEDDIAGIVRDRVQPILSGELPLQICKFTPIRPSVGSKESRHYQETVFIDGEEYIGFATNVLNQALRIVMTLHRDGATAEANEADLDALEIMLKGLRGAFLTGSLNAQLMGLEKEWRLWWKEWQESPPDRDAGFQHLEGARSSRKAFEPARYVRHRVDSILTNISEREELFCDVYPITDTERNGIKAGKLIDTYRTRIRAYDTFIRALHDCRDRLAKSPDNRLLLTIAAYRGLGKGTFLTAMSSRLGLSVYNQVAWPKVAPGEPQPFVAAACFINLSFSTEIASCFDSLVCALEEICSVMEAAQKDLKNGAAPDAVRGRLEESLHPAKPGTMRPYDCEQRGSVAQKARQRMVKSLTGVSRIQRIESLFVQFRSLSQNFASFAGFGRPRFLLYISGLELLYKDDQQAKNREATLLLDLIFGANSQAFPVDLVCVGSEYDLGYPVSLEPGDERRPFAQRLLKQNDLPPRAEEQIRQRISDGRLKIDEGGLAAPTPAGDAGTTDGTGTPAGPPAVNHVHFCRPVNTGSLLVDNFPVLATALYIENPPGKYRDFGHRQQAVEAAINDLSQTFVKAVRRGREQSDTLMSELWKRRELPDSRDLDEARKEVWRIVEEDCEKKLLAHAALAIDDLPPGRSMRDLLSERLERNETGERDEWRRVRRFIGYNRFTITILMAAAEQIIIHTERPDQCGEEAQEFIRSTVDQVRTVGQHRREELILQAVIERYRRYHLIGDCDLDTELHQMILRHLGVIGLPMNAAVLVRLPAFRDYFQRIGIELETSRRRFLTRALTVLTYRGLVFRIDPHPGLVALEARKGHAEDKYWPAKHDYRYALHRTVQRYAISKMGVGNADPVRSNSFAPRLYSSMPSIGTGLSLESYDFLRTLLIGLSQYPDIAYNDLNLRPWLFTTNYKYVKVQALRAALSLARSTMSVATLSRLSTRADGEPGVPPLGLLENYKIRLRWIIRMAAEMFEKKDIAPRGQDLEAKPEHTNSLYRDEIVWLYNELGVISLSQGNLNDALGYLRQAAEHNEEIEGRSRYGPIFDYIDLNHAIVQLERGRLDSAIGRLKRIRKNAANEALLAEISEGYLCVIQHIRGDYSGLKERYRKVVRNIQELGDKRATALFLSHRARFLAATNDESAADELGLAQSLAETGGHEDVRHHIELARLTVEYRKKVDNGAMGMGESTNALEQLHEIEVYGRRMGMWSLQVDALKLHSEILLSEGETSTAGALLIRCMAIAKRNRMTLRLNGAVNLYARILLRRKDRHGARRHAEIALEMAKTIGYNRQTSYAQQTLAEAEMILVDNADH